ncbi:RING/U-box superfamily protein [Striga hermonthica]|uniref:RING/U-box superfamily protein n=1 Tax=Striga hermonthica TaxID=68872 RepID=A0A9N7RM40_STRHE|nr:RING/U-box superfamily protein [Striga hermonthica]
MKKQIMEQMDIDHIVDVPDTPDRLTTQRIKGKNIIEVENHSLSPPLYPQKQNVIKDGSKDQPMIVDSGSRALSLRPKKCISISNSPRCPVNSTISSFSSSSPLRNASLFQKGATEKNSSYRSHDYINNHSQQSLRPSCIPESFSPDDSFVDLTGKDTCGPVIGKSNVSSSVVSRTNFLTASHAGAKMDVGGVGSSNAVRGEVGFIGNNVQEKPGSGFLSRDAAAPPRINKQKRLVRNGCISPNNIAKIKQLDGKDSNSSISVGHDNNSSVASAHNNNGSIAFAHRNKSSKPSCPQPVPFDIRELVADDNDAYVRKGKGVVTHSCSSKDDSRSNALHSRSSMKFCEKAIGPSSFNIGAGKNSDKPGGWRSTHNRSSEMNVLSPDEELCVVREKAPLRYSSQHHVNNLERSKKGVSVTVGDNKGKDFISLERSYPPHSKESFFHHQARPGQLNGSSSTANTLIKRQKQGLASSSRECSTSVSDDPEVVLLPTSTYHNANNLEQIIEVAELSPQLKHNACDDDVARARQVEADEALARELQEQLYSELPVFGAAEVDEHIALALQHQDNSVRGPARSRNHISSASASMLNLQRQSRGRSSLSGPRRGSVARSASSGRLTRLRSRFPGQARRLVYSGDSSSIFPEDMDVEMRMHILGALEEFNDMGLSLGINDIGLSAGILQVPRDFNENDYEMLLALDDNNDQHSGCSVHQINGLPQSKVHTENFDETCAVCLETPTIGDSIRHLPCLHKFHKDIFTFSTRRLGFWLFLDAEMASPCPRVAFLAPDPSTTATSTVSEDTSEVFSAFLNTSFRSAVKTRWIRRASSARWQTSGKTMISRRFEADSL